MQADVSSWPKLTLNGQNGRPLLSGRRTAWGLRTLGYASSNEFRGRPELYKPKEETIFTIGLLTQGSARIS